MKRINAAFHERNVDKLQSMRAEAEIEDPAFESRSISDKLIWAIREISRLDDLVVAIGAERETLQASELALLWQRQRAGENVIERLDLDLRGQIERERQRLKYLIEQFALRNGNM